MPITNTQSTPTVPSSVGGYQTPPSSISNRVEGVAFNVLFSQEPTLETEQLRFELTECKKTGSSYYTIVTWKGKRYRITVHENKRKLAYSEADWQQVEARTIKVLDKVQNNKHFFRGTLQLHAKTQKKWKFTYENNTPHVEERSVNKKIIREFKKLLEDQIKPINPPPASKAPKRLERDSYSLSNSNFIHKPEKKEETSFFKKSIKKVKTFLSQLKSNTDEHIEETERKKGRFERIKDCLFPSNNLDYFDDLTSSDTASISSFEGLDNNHQEDLDDNTSLGGITTASRHISNDSGSSYSPEISPGKR